MTYLEIFKKFVDTPPLIPIGRWMHTPVYLHWSWLLLLLFVLVVDPLTACALAGVCLLLILHELGHSHAAYVYGYETKAIIVYIIGGVSDPIKDGNTDYDLNYKQEMWILFCGPLVNLILVPFLMVLHWTFPDLTFVRQIMLFNFVVFFLNLLPVYPLDCGKFILSVFSHKFGKAKGTLYTVRLSNLLSIIIGVLSIVNGYFVMAIIALFIYHASRQEISVFKRTNVE